MISTLIRSFCELSRIIQANLSVFRENNVSGKQCFGKTRIISVEYEMIFFLSLSISLYRRFRKTMFKENIV